MTPYIINPITGSNQGTGPNMPFPLLLSALVLDQSGLPVPGVQVAFNAIAPGACCTFVGGNVTTTDTNGLAVMQCVANGVPGAFNVLANVGGVSCVAPFLLTIY
jgi:hypothetical protein